MGVRASYLRAVRARGLAPGLVDTDEHLVELVLGADEEAAEDLRRRALAPLAALAAGSAERLAETLRSWLLNQGRRDAVAAELFVHPQTVRYRMGQIRELYGDRLTDPAVVLELTVALGISPSGRV
jgi:DNA-binding PucR family transcriptional regulator